MKKTFWELLGESVITQSIITIAVLAIWLYLLVIGREVPSELTNIVGLVVGFFFGGKYALAMNRAAMMEAASIAATKAIETENKEDADNLQ